MPIMRPLLAFLPAVLLAAGEGIDLCRFGSFDDPADTRPPKGWIMWGEVRFKDPANYTIDTVDPHAGAGCFRLFQPKGTGGYINTEPAQAITPKAGMRYEYSFWARSDAPGTSTMVIEGYTSVADFSGYRQVGRLAFATGTAWAKVSLTLHEGWDFSLGRTNRLMTAFMPAGGHAERDRTLWLDDIRIVESPSDRPGRMIEPASVPAPPLEHRLKPGDSLRVTIDAGKRLRKLDAPVTGVSFHRVAGWMGLPFDRQGTYVLPQELEDAVRDLRLPMTRFYGVGDEAFPLEAAIDKAADMCRRAGIPAGNVVLELEPQDASRTLSPEDWVRGVRHAAATKLGFNRWEIANEPYGFHAKVFATKDDYLTHFLAVSAAIRAAQPGAKIGLAAWGQDLYLRAAGSYDFVVNHHYVFGPPVDSHPIEDIALGANYDKLGEIAHLNAYLKACNPGREVVQYDTEWGMHCDGPRGATHNRRNANIYGTLHRAVRMLYYAREGLVAGASSWELFGPRPEEGYTFGFIPKDAPGKRFLFYWLYHCMNRHLGAWAVDIAGTAPWYTPPKGLFPEHDASGPLTPVMASLDEAGDKLFIIAINGSWGRQVPCEITLAGFSAGRITGICLSSDDPDASPLVERRENVVKPLPVTQAAGQLRCTLPAHAAAFLTIERQR